MQEEKFEIEDSSNDKKYFSLIPHYILNHSTAVAQALYMQLKKLSGENGYAYPSRAYLMERLGISKPTLIKEIQYLIEKGWIKECGEKIVMTNGGQQKVKKYQVIDIWKLNVDHYQEKYKGVKNNTHLDTKGVKNNTKGGKKYYSKGVKNRPPNKNHINNNQEEEYSENSSLSFKSIVSPFYKTYLKNIPQKDIEYFIKTYKVNEDQIKEKAKNLELYNEGQKNRIKNFKAVLESWILRDFGLRKIDYTKPKYFKSDEELYNKK